MKSEQMLAISVGAVLALFLWGMPQWNIYSRALSGKAALMEAESTRQVRVLEAKAKMEAAKLEAAAEVERAQGSAQAIAAVKDQLGGPSGYLRWLYLQGLQEQGGTNQREVVYIPTDGLVPLPLSEAGRAAR